MEGERKDTGHGEGKGVSTAQSVPLRRWEDWERSRLRKIRREDRRRREFARQHGGFVLHRLVSKHQLKADAAFT